MRFVLKAQLFSSFEMILAFLLCVSLLQGLVRSQDSVTTQKQNLINPKTAQSCNINNYNSFYAGPNKKFENLMLDVKRQLDEIQMELRNLTKKDDDKLKLKGKILICNCSL